jgi:hypothetical protein
MPLLYSYICRCYKSYRGSHHVNELRHDYYHRSIILNIYAPTSKVQLIFKACFAFKWMNQDMITTIGLIEKLMITLYTISNMYALTQLIFKAGFAFKQVWNKQTEYCGIKCNSGLFLKIYLPQYTLYYNLLYIFMYLC